MIQVCGDSLLSSEQPEEPLSTAYMSHDAPGDSLLFYDITFIYFKLQRFVF